MTEYSTGNPVGSSDPRDLYDNAQNLDLLMLGPALNYKDRLGAQRLSWKGIETNYNEWLAATEYEVPVDYASLAQIDRYSQTISHDGHVYRLRYGESLPFVLSGNWDSDILHLTILPDASLQAVVSDLEEKIAHDAPLNMAMYSRSLVREVGFRDATYDSLLSTYGYDFLYPQSFAVDEVADELFILKGPGSGSNSWAWIWVYELSTGILKTVFTTGQQWRECLVVRYVGATRYIYTIGSSNSVIRADVTSLPAMMGTVTPSVVWAGPAQSFMAFDGNNWYVQDFTGYFGLTRRNIFRIFSEDFSTELGKLTLPEACIGTLQGYINYFPKAQGLTFHAGALYVGTGGAYDPDPGTLNPDDAVYLIGGQAFSTTGSLLAQALTRPIEHMAKMGEMLGYTNTVSECEGYSSSGDNLFSCFVTLGPGERTDSANAGRGIVVCLELSKADDRVDFSYGARGVRSPIDLVRFQAEIHHSSSQLRNPVTGNALTSFSSIVTMMIQLGLSRYAFGGTNQSMVDINGAPVSVSGALVEFTNVNGSSINVEIVGSGYDNPRYWISNATVAPVQAGPVYGASFTASGNSLSIRYDDGTQEVILNETTGVACTTAAGSLFRSDSAYTWTFPQAFLAGSAPVVTVNPSYGLRIAGGSTGVPNATGCSLVIFSASSDATLRPFQARAVGRWK